MPTRKQKRAKRMRARSHQEEIQGRTKIVEQGGMKIEVPRGKTPQPSRPKNAPRRDARGQVSERLDAGGRIRKALAEIGIEEPSRELRREFSRLTKATGSTESAKGILSSALADAEKKIKAKPFLRPKTPLFDDLSRLAESLGGYSGENLARIATGDVYWLGEDAPSFISVLEKHGVSPIPAPSTEHSVAPTSNEIEQMSPEVFDAAEALLAGGTDVAEPTDETWAEIVAEAKASRKGAKGYIRAAQKRDLVLIEDGTVEGPDPKLQSSWTVG